MFINNYLTIINKYKEEPSKQSEGIYVYFFKKLYSAIFLLKVKNTKICLINLPIS